MELNHNAFKILIIDDEQHIRLSFADFLEDQDFKVVLAENGRVGLDFIKTEAPDLVLLDLRMPEMDGLEVLKKGREINADLPMIVISGANRVGDVVRALRLGAWDYLEKPVQDFSILKHAVNKALEKAFLIKQNAEYQEHLESMVEDKTRELAGANNRLSDINKRLHKIVKTAQSLAGCNKMKVFSSKIMDEFSKHMDASGGSIYLSADNGLRLLHTLDPGHAAEFIEFPLAENSVFNKIFKSGKPLLIDDIDDRKDIESSGWNKYGNGSLIALPILDSEGHFVGLISLHNKLEPPFDEQDKEIAAILASQCSETIRAIRAFEIVRESEIKLRQSQKMEAIGTLAGGIAHDFNNILSGIIGYAQLVEMNVNKPDNIKKNIDQIMKGTRRATDLVTQILTFSRQIEYEKKPLKIYLIVKEAVKFLRSSIPSTIEIVEKINTKNVVLADSTQIHQVVMNLCTNAYHSMRDTGGILTVSLFDITIDECADNKNCVPGSYIQLDVKDTGKGINKEDLDRIFDPYFTTKKVSQGTGLGLAVVSGIVKKHNGFINVVSEPGKGTEIRVLFPVAEKDTNKKARVRPSAEDTKGSEKIMLVDDEQDILDPTKAILGNMGYYVEGFADSLSALDAFEKDPERFDCVITDMTMPKMKGDALSEKILAIREDIPVILCTGYHESFTEKEALRLGIRRFVQKPVAGKQLASIIREELGK